MKIRYFLATALASIALFAAAQTESDPMYMVLTMKSGEHKAVNINDVSRLTFSNGNMTVSKKDSSNENVSIANIANMEFSNNQEGGVDNVTVSGSAISFNPADGAIRFCGETGKVFAIYTTDGMLVLSYTTEAGMQSIDINAIPSGIYIILYNGQSLKILK